MAKFEVFIEKIEPIRKISLGVFEVPTKSDAIAEGHFELGLHWVRYLEPEEDVSVKLSAKKLKEVVGLSGRD